MLALKWKGKSLNLSISIPEKCRFGDDNEENDDDMRMSLILQSTFERQIYNLKTGVAQKPRNITSIEPTILETCIF